MMKSMLRAAALAVAMGAALPSAQAALITFGSGALPDGVSVDPSGTSAPFSSTDGALGFSVSSGVIGTGATFGWDKLTPILGLGVNVGAESDSRINGSESIVITALPGFSVTINSVTFQGLNFSPLEGGQYYLNGASSVPFLQSGAPVDPNQPYTVTFAGGVSLSDLKIEGYQGTITLYEIDYTATPTAVPLPATLALLGAGFAGLGALRRRQTA